MLRRGYVAGSLVGAAILVALVLSATAERPLFGSSRPFLGSRAAPKPPAPNTSTGAVGGDGSLFPRWVVVGATVLLLLYAASLLLLLVLHRRGRLDTGSPRSGGVPEDPEDDWQTLLSAEVAEAAAAQLADIGLGTARDAIIACWLRLHTATRGAGLEPAPSETPAEFTERALRRLRVDEGAVTDLAALYREARFSDHVMSGAQRLRAAEALQVVAGQLAGQSAGQHAGTRASA